MKTLFLRFLVIKKTALLRLGVKAHWPKNNALDIFGVNAYQCQNDCAKTSLVVVSAAKAFSPILTLFPIFKGKHQARVIKLHYCKHRRLQSVHKPQANNAYITFSSGVCKV